MTRSAPAGSEPSTKQDDRRAPRRAFVAYLYGLHAALNGNNRHLATGARRELAVLRRSLAGRRQQAEALGLVFPHNPPRYEEDVWLLVAGLFAIHPQPRARAQGQPRRSIGFAMGQLQQSQGDAADRRFVQLLGVEIDSLPFYLRQAVRLLRGHGILLDFDKLMDDLVTLLTQHLNDPFRREEEAHRVRLGWARDYHWDHRRPDSVPAAADNASKATAMATNVSEPNR